MRTIPTLFKTLFLTLLLSLAAHGAFAQTEVNIAAPVPAFEGTGAGTTPFTFTITRSGPGPYPASFNVAYAVSGQVAAPEDYNAPSGTVAFTSATQATATVTIGIKRDTKHEIDEDLTITLISADNGVTVGLGSPIATTQVLNEDDQPTITINDRTVAEGTSAIFTITRSNPSYLPVGVLATTGDGSANGVITAPFPQPDYTTNAPGTTVNFVGDALTATFTVPTINDAVYEGGFGGTPETFVVTLSSPNNALIADNTGDGFITDNESKPTVSFSTLASQSEAVALYPFTVTLNRQSSETIIIPAITINGTANDAPNGFGNGNPKDYDALVPPSVTFGPGFTSQVVNIAINNDLINEINETFSMQLTFPANVFNTGTLSRTAIIVDNDAPPVLDLGVDMVCSRTAAEVLIA